MNATQKTVKWFFCCLQAAFFALGAVLAMASAGDIAPEEKIIDEKIKELSKGIEKRTSQDKLLLMVLHLQRKDYPQVVTIYKEEKKDREDLFFQMALIQALIGQKDYSHVVGHLDRLASKHKGSSIEANAIYFRGLIYWKKGELGQARECFIGAMEQDPTFPLPYFYLSSLARNNNEKIRFAAQTLSLVQPDSEIAKKTIKLICDTLK